MKFVIYSFLALLVVQSRATVVYNSLQGDWATQQSSLSDNALVAIDDYDTHLAVAQFKLETFDFIGGIDVALKPITFKFFNSDMSLANSFSTILFSEGIHRWNVSLAMNIPSKGFVAMYRDEADSSYAALWRGQSDAPLVGTSDLNLGSWSGGSMQMLMGTSTVPEPSTLVALATIATIALRRKNRA